MMNTNILKESSRGVQPISISDIHFRNRVIFFTDDVTPTSMERLISQLLFLESEAPGEPVTLIINSPGGDVESGFAAVDVIEGMTSPLTTVCTGIAASMGAILFLAGSSRIITPHSKLLIHDPSYGAGNLSGVKPLNIKEDLDRLMAVRSELAEYISKRTGQPKDDVLELTKTDYWMSANKALKFGAATEIRRFVLPADEQ